MAKYGDFKNVKTLTSEMLKQKDEADQITVWETAVQWRTFDKIPLDISIELVSSFNIEEKGHFLKTIVTDVCYNDFTNYIFTKEVLDVKDDMGYSGFHYCARSERIGSIPKHLFTKEALESENHNGNSVWHFVGANKGQIKLIPANLINKELLTLKNAMNHQAFDKDDTAYINHVLAMPNRLNEFFLANPSLERDVEFRDSRLKLIKAAETELTFSFDGIDDTVILNKLGACTLNFNRGFCEGKNHQNLNDAVAFIEKTYPQIIEQSIPIP